MRVGLIDVDGHNFPNLPLMKLSAWHKHRGDSVEWYNPLVHGFPADPMDRVYVSKVFSFTPDYPYFVNAREIRKGGSGYAIHTKKGLEVYDKGKDIDLPYGIEHIYPDYGLYPEHCKDTAYGFLTRGCPRGCSFCHTGTKDGLQSRKVADLSEFWNGQKNIVLLDQNLLAAKEAVDLLSQLIDSKAYVEFNGGLDIRLMTEEIACLMKQIKVKMVHFAWDRYGDKELIIPRLKMFKEISGWESRKTSVYVLTNFDTTIGQDLERIYTLRDMDYDPYVMVYDREQTRSRDTVRRLQRWVNKKSIFKSVSRFEDYKG